MRCLPRLIRATIPFSGSGFACSPGKRKRHRGMSRMRCLPRLIRATNPYSGHGFVCSPGKRKRHRGMSRMRCLPRLIRATVPYSGHGFVCSPGKRKRHRGMSRMRCLPRLIRATIPFSASVLIPSPRPSPSERGERTCSHVLWGSLTPAGEGEGNQPLLFINRQQMKARQHMNNGVARAETENQDNHRLAAPYAIVRATETFTRCAGQQRWHNRRPDGCC